MHSGMGRSYLCEDYLCSTQLRLGNLLECERMEQQDAAILAQFDGSGCVSAKRAPEINVRVPEGERCGIG